MGGTVPQLKGHIRVLPCEHHEQCKHFVLNDAILDLLNSSILCLIQFQCISHCILIEVSETGSSINLYNIPKQNDGIVIIKKTKEKEKGNKRQIFIHELNEVK